MQLNVRRFALATGVLWGLGLFVVTLVATGRGIGDHLRHLDSIYPGYQISFLGSVVGALYAFVSGLLAGGLFSAIYNWGGKRDSRI
jgi:hypothetical protein